MDRSTQTGPPGRTRSDHPARLVADDLSAWECDVLATDGAVVHLRPLVGSDHDSILAFYQALSAEAVYTRFFTHRLPSADDLTAIVDEANPDRFILGAEVNTVLVGIGEYTKSPTANSAEVAFAIADEHQHRGIGTLLLEHLAARALDRGISSFDAHVLPRNLAMIDVFSRAGYVVETLNEGGEVEVSFVLDEAADESISSREQRAEARSIGRLLAPAVVAVVGASRRPGSVGNALFHNIISGGFTGTAYPVNPHATSVMAVPAYRSIADIAERVDLAVIAVPPAEVQPVLEECGAAGVSGAIIVTAGFAESGVDGAAAEAHLVRTARRFGMRLVGPNCIGILNTHPDVALDATFSPIDPVPGNVSFASQSGALGIALLDHAAQVGMGVASFVSLGNKADVSGNDLLQYWEADPETAVGVLYLESFGNPRKFARLARRFCRTKPLVVVKSGRSDAGRRAASSHTAALSSDDVLIDALFRQAGIIRLDTLAELFDVTRLLSQQPIPAGSRVGIVGNSGGPGILAADACAAAGLVVPELSEETKAKLSEMLPPGAGVTNPVDLVASARGPEYEAAIDLLLADETIDSVIVIYTDPMLSEAGDITAAIGRSVTRNGTKPVVANFLAADVGRSITEATTGGRHRAIPVYDFPESAASALGHAAGLGIWRARDHGVEPHLDGIDRLAAAVTIGEALTSSPEGGWLETGAIRRLFDAYGIELTPTLVVRSAHEARAAAEQLGRPVTLKVISPEIVHKTEAGGVTLNLEHPDDAASAYREMAERLADSMTGAIVQPMAPAGVEVIVGALADETFGPVVMFGAGGTAAELWRDREFALAPLTDTQAHELVNAPKVATLLRGHRGSPPVDLAAIEALVLRTSALVSEIAEVAELDLNPVIATPAGLHVVDARCRITPLKGPRVLPRRRLRASPPPRPGARR